MRPAYQRIPGDSTERTGLGGRGGGERAGCGRNGAGESAAGPGSRGGQRLTWRREAGLTFRALRQAGGSATAALRAASRPIAEPHIVRGVVSISHAHVEFPLKGTQRIGVRVGEREQPLAGWKARIKNKYEHNK